MLRKTDLAVGVYMLAAIIFFIIVLVVLVSNIVAYRKTRSKKR